MKRVPSCSGDDDDTTSGVTPNATVSSDPSKRPPVMTMRVPTAAITRGAKKDASAMPNG